MNTNQKIVSVAYYDYLCKDICETMEIRTHNKFSCNIDRKTFADGECYAAFNESIRGQHIIVIGETSHSFAETLIIIDAARRNSAKEITLVLPYYGYARQDKKDGKRSCVAPSIFARVFELAGVNRVISIDVHAEQIVGHYLIPFDHLLSGTLFIDYIKQLIVEEPGDYVFCTPDAGGHKRVERYADYFNLPMVNINKERSAPGKIKSMELFGNVSGKKVILIDDIYDSGGTIQAANDLLNEKGAIKVYNLITHAIISDPLKLKKLIKTGGSLITTNTLSEVYKYSEVKFVNCCDVICKSLIEVLSEGSINSINEN